MVFLGLKHERKREGKKGGEATFRGPLAWALSLSCCPLLYFFQKEKKLAAYVFSVNFFLLFFCCFFLQKIVRVTQIQTVKPPFRSFLSNCFFRRQPKMRVTFPAPLYFKGSTCDTLKGNLGCRRSSRYYSRMLIFTNYIGIRLPFFPIYNSGNIWYSRWVILTVISPI